MAWVVVGINSSLSQELMCFCECLEYEFTTLRLLGTIKMVSSLTIPPGAPRRKNKQNLKGHVLSQLNSSHLRVKGKKENTFQLAYKSKL